MDLSDAFKKAVMAGIGAQERAKEMFEELAKKGELSESQASKYAKEWSEKTEKSSAEFTQALHEIVAKAIEKMPVPTKTELDALKKEIAELRDRLARYEARQ